MLFMSVYDNFSTCFSVNLLETISLEVLRKELFFVIILSPLMPLLIVDSSFT
jgi:hypothetical protein